MMCHGSGAVSGGYAPDLRASPLPLSPAAFKRVVVDGALRHNGMPDFAEFTDKQLASLRHFIRRAAGVPQVLNALQDSEQ